MFAFSHLNIQLQQFLYYLSHSHTNRILNGEKCIMEINYIQAKIISTLQKPFFFMHKNTITDSYHYHNYDHAKSHFDVLKMSNGCFTFKSIQFPAVTSVRHKMDKWVESGFK